MIKDTKRLFAENSIASFPVILPMLKSYLGRDISASILAIITLLSTQIAPAILSQPALAKSCVIVMSPPDLNTIHSQIFTAPTVGQEFVLSVVANNCTSEDIPFVALIEVRNSEGITESIDWQSGILKGDGLINIGISWTPAHGDDFEIRSFAITDFVIPNVLSAVSNTHVEIAEANSENLALEFHFSKTELSTGEAYGTSYYLVNNGMHTVSLAIDEYVGIYKYLLRVEHDGSHTVVHAETPQREGPDSSCLWKYATRIMQPDAILKPGEMMNLTERSSESVAPIYPGIYNYSPFVILSVQGQERVKCLEIVGNTVTLNVTAPVYEGVSLVLGTDKQVYVRNETVRFSLYIENNSSETFKLQDASPLITVRDEYDSEIFRTGFAPSFSQLPVIEPHSIYRLDYVPLTWDQKDYYNVAPDSTEPAEAKAGVYSVMAHFVYPYLESEILTITILD